MKYYSDSDYGCKNTAEERFFTENKYSVIVLVPHNKLRKKSESSHMYCAIWNMDAIIPYWYVVDINLEFRLCLSAEHL